MDDEYDDDIDYEPTQFEIEYYRQAAEFTRAYDKACSLRFWIILIGFCAWANLSLIWLSELKAQQSEAEILAVLIVIASVPVLLVVYAAVSWLYSPLKKHISNQISQNEQVV